MHVQAELDARKEAAEGARHKAAASGPNVASAVGTLLAPPPRDLEADLRKLSQQFVLCQHGFRNLDLGDLDNADCTWAELFESQVVLREQTHLPRALLDSVGHPILSPLAREVAAADKRLTEALANFANAHASASDPAVRATIPGLFRLDAGILALKQPPPVGFRPELAHSPFLGIVPVVSGSVFDNTCPLSLVLVRDTFGRTFAVHAPTQEVAQFNGDCKTTYRHHGAVDEGVGRPRVDSAAPSRTAAALSGSMVYEHALQPIGFDDDVSTAHDDYQHDRIPDRNQQHQQAATPGLSPPRHPVESAQESDRPGGRRQSLRVASSVATPTRPEPGPHVPLVSPINGSGAKFHRKRMVPKATQLFLLVNDMMLELERHRVKGFGRALEYGNFGFDDAASGKTLSPEGLAVRLALMCPLRMHARV